jgi:hypothetical protein
MEPTPGREPLNYGLILLFLALVAYAAIGLTLRAEPVSGDELSGLGELEAEAGAASWGSGSGGRIVGGREVVSAGVP